jgi:hypothetical protein
LHGRCCAAHSCTSLHMSGATGGIAPAAARATALANAARAETFRPRMMSLPAGNRPGQRYPNIILTVLGRQMELRAGGVEKQRRQGEALSSGTRLVDMPRGSAMQDGEQFSWRVDPNGRA